MELIGRRIQYGKGRPGRAVGGWEAVIEKLRNIVEWPGKP